MHKFESELPKRKKNRLPYHDYSECGAYFVTICIQDREPILWTDEVNVGANIVRPPALSDIGLVIDNKINEISIRYTAVKVDKYMIMPNHIHLIIVLENNSQCGRTMFAPTLSCIIKQFKGAVTKQIGWSIWQRSFHDHIIRNEDEYRKIWDYIEYNPVNWQQDCYYELPRQQLASPN